MVEPRTDWLGAMHNVSVLWLTIGAGAIAVRSIQLCFLRDVQTGLVWAVKIVTDPFHDIALYYKSPLCLLRGETFDPVIHDQPA